MALAQQVTSGAFTGGYGLRDELDLRNRETGLPPPADEPSLLTLTIELRGVKPRIWRRLSLPGDLTLDVVHTLFQAAMGWKGAPTRYALGQGAPKSICRTSPLPGRMAACRSVRSAGSCGVRWPVPRELR